MVNQDQKSGLENTLFSLLERGGGPDLNQGSLLILISLVNLMGIINLLAQRSGIPKDKQEDSLAQ